MVSRGVLGTKPAGGDPDAHELLDWVRSGGTAVVFGGTVNQWKRLEINAGTVAGNGDTLISGDFAPVVRRLSGSGLLHLQAADRDSRVTLWGENTPFALRG